jgi:NAD(P) transhydrogenase subunit alpha
MVKSMAPGSVIVDLAAERGGNCELTEASKIVVKHGVSIVGYINLASTVPYHASQMYARNISTFLTHLFKGGKPELALDDEITRETMITQGGQVVHARVREFFSLPALAAQKASQ